MGQMTSLHLCPLEIAREGERDKTSYQKQKQKSYYRKTHQVRSLSSLYLNVIRPKPELGKT